MRRMVTNAEIEKLGGTKLYKHTITFNLNDEEGSVRAEIVNTISTSLAGHTIPESQKNLHGILSYNYSYNPILYIDEACVVWYYIEGTEIRTNTISGNVLTDTVTAL